MEKPRFSPETYKIVENLAICGVIGVVGYLVYDKIVSIIPLMRHMTKHDVVLVGVVMLMRIFLGDILPPLVIETAER